MTQSNRSNTKTWQIVAHLSALCWLVGIPGAAGPLVVWLMYRTDVEIEPHAREALNFHVSTLIYGAGLVILGVLLVVTIIGTLLVPFLILGGIALAVFAVVVTIIGGVQASNGILYRYPLNLRLID